MDLQGFVETFSSLTAVISVEKADDGSCGKIRIAAGNRKFIELVEDPTFSLSSPENRCRFVPGTEYDKFLPKNLSFEDICFRSAVDKKPIHTYIHTIKPDQWFDVYTMPIEGNDKGLYHCTFSMEICELENIDLMSTQSLKTSSDVLKTCIKLHDTNDFKKTMDEVIKDIRMICDAEVCTIMLTDLSTGSCSVLATNLKEGTRLKRVTQFTNFYDIAASWIDTIGDSDCLIIKSDSDMKYISRVNEPWYKTLVEANVKSVVMFPLRYNSDVLGFIWATNFDTRCTMQIKETLELTTFFISSEIASYKMMKRLERISYTDMLTGVFNRNAMNNRITEIVSGEAVLDKPYGIVFADLNGLKRVNDSDGHSAGDILLKKAAIVIQETFPGCEIYRAGGDEYMVIAVGADKEDFEERVALLKKKACDPVNVCFAVGCHYSQPEFDIRTAMHCADENMYKDKEDFYQRYPELKIR